MAEEEKTKVSFFSKANIVFNSQFLVTKTLPTEECFCGEKSKNFEFGKNSQFIENSRWKEKEALKKKTINFFIRKSGVGGIDNKMEKS